MRMKRRIVWAAAVALVCLGAWCLWGNTALTVCRVEVFGAGVPEAFDGYRIVQLSDLHDACFGADNEELIRRVAEEEPSILVLTGDMIDSRRTDIEPTVALAKRLSALAPTYYVTGNHEARVDGEVREALLTDLRGAGVRVLRSEAVELTRGGESLRLIGLDDLGIYYRAIEADEGHAQADAAQILEDAKAALRRDLEALAQGEEYALLLSHRPELIDLYAECGVGLALCGHAHGGQVRVPFLGGLYAPGQGWFPDYDAGVYEARGTQLAVSRGLGNSAFPLRVNNRPEIVTITLRRASETN